MQASASWKPSKTQVCSTTVPTWLTSNGLLCIDEVYKSAKLSTNGSSARRSQVQDEPEDDAEAGPEPPPNDLDDEGEAGPELPPDDEDGGRFFGGGMTARETEILDFVDGADDEGAPPEKIDAPWLRKTALNFEKHITKNAELRAKYESQPQKFIDSEADLDADIKGLSLLSEHPALWPDFAKLGCAGSLVGLLAHENTDIAISAIMVIVELTGEDVGAEDGQWDALVDAMLEADLIGLIVSNFSRLNEDDEADRDGVYHALSVLENLCSRSSVATRLGEDTALLKWLLSRTQRSEKQVSQNKQYAAEILAILSQASIDNRQKLVAADAVDTALQLVAAYRRQDPERGSEEEEYMEDLFQVLTCLVDGRTGKEKFLEAEGVELCLLMLKDGKMSKPPALRLLDHAVGGEETSGEVCQRLVEAGGLKSIFTLFTKSKDSRLLPHLLGIFNSLLRHLPASSPERIRTLAKFVENDYQKTTKLAGLHAEYAARLRRVEEQIAAEKKAEMDGGASAEELEESELVWDERRTDAGLPALQSVDVILAWLAAEDSGAAARIKKLLAERDDSFESIRVTIQKQRKEIESSLERPSGGTLSEAEEQRERDLTDQRDMLGTLIEFLQ